MALPPYPSTHTPPWHHYKRASGTASRLAHPAMNTKDRLVALPPYPSTHTPPWYHYRRASGTASLSNTPSYEYTKSPGRPLQPHYNITNILSSGTRGGIRAERKFSPQPHKGWAILMHTLGWGTTKSHMDAWLERTSFTPLNTHLK